MPTSQRVFSGWLRSEVAPVLREHGFQGTGQDYHRRMGSNWAAINFQRNRYSTADELRFTINMGTASAVALEAARRDPEEPVPEVICHWRLRLQGQHLGYEDTWWTVRANEKSDRLERLSAEVHEALVARGLPLLERMATDEAILASNSRGSNWADLAPAEMDIVGPILRKIGPATRFRDYIDALDRADPPTRMYEIYEEYPLRMGPARTAKALADLQRKGFEPRSLALLRLAFASPTPEVRTAVRTQLHADDPYIQGHAAFAAGHLGDVEMAPRLAQLIEQGNRYTCCTAALASLRLAPRVADRDRALINAALAQRHADAVGHERPLLAHVMKRMPEIAGGAAEQ